MKTKAPCSSSRPQVRRVPDNTVSRGGWVWVVVPSHTPLGAVFRGVPFHSCLHFILLLEHSAFDASLPPTLMAFARLPSTLFKAGSLRRVANTSPTCLRLQGTRPRIRPGSSRVSISPLQVRRRGKSQSSAGSQFGSKWLCGSPAV